MTALRDGISFKRTISFPAVITPQSECCTYFLFMPNSITQHEKKMHWNAREKPEMKRKEVQCFFTFSFWAASGDVYGHSQLIHMPSQSVSLGISLPLHAEVRGIESQ
jgi:hypothetical protein